uniref:LMBR1-like membrane protein n=1 Tax=Araucaria cunninghamii TaxID=56994 RepID=A0A0D6QV51_ARACU
MHREWGGSMIGLAMACSNTFGLVTGAFLLGFGLVEIPRSIWRNANWTYRQKVLSHRVAKMAVKLDDAHQDLSNAIVIAQATSNQMSKRDPLRPCMDVIDNMLAQMNREDPNFKPSGGRLGENDMDYDADEKSMANLRYQLRRAREEYYRYKSEYMSNVCEALELDDTIKNYERGSSTEWRYISSFRPPRSGSLAQYLDVMEWVWRCVLRQQLEKVLAVLLGCMSTAILLAEATLLPSGVDLSLFSIIIKAVGKQEMLVQVTAFVPLMYMCICTYYSLFKLGMFTFYSLTPKQTSSVSLLMICSMVARYAPPISYNFLNMIHLDGNAKTTFEKRMGNIDDAVPFFGQGFNKIYPLFMVIYTMLLASNFFDRVIDFFGSWWKFRFETEAEDADGFDQSGTIILKKERSWLEQGHSVGEHVIPLARNFNNVSDDIEADTIPKKSTWSADDAWNKSGPELKVALTKDVQGSHSKIMKEDYQTLGSKGVIASKYAALREHQTKPSNLPSGLVQQQRQDVRPPVQHGNAGDIPNSRNEFDIPSGLTTKWQSMKSSFQNIKASIGARRFAPLRQSQEREQARPQTSTTETLDTIFERLKRRKEDNENNEDDADLRFVRSAR